MTEPMLDLTIIIPSYNTRELLRDCIQSIYQHTEGHRFRNHLPGRQLSRSKR